MPIHTVSENETLFTIAEQHGFRNWRAIYEHPDNEELRAERPDPMVLAAGDSVVIPDKVAPEFSCATGETHRFRLHAPKCFVSVYLKDEMQEPYAGCKYELAVGDETYQGVLGESGLVAHEVPPNIAEAELKLWPDPDNPDEVVEWTLQVGHLDPVDTISGTQSRLNNLGYNAGEVTGAMNAETTAALKDFQQSLGNGPATGEIDDATRQALLDATNNR